VERLDSELPCRLDGEACRGGECPFWVHGECLLAEVDVRGQPDLVAWLLELRRDLGAA
jgi:hypothetical protein